MCVYVCVCVCVFAPLDRQVTSPVAVLLQGFFFWVLFPPYFNAAILACPQFLNVLSFAFLVFRFSLLLFLLCFFPHFSIIKLDLCFSYHHLKKQNHTNIPKV